MSERRSGERPSALDDDRLGLEQLPEGVVVADEAGRLVQANRRAELLTRLPLLDRLGEDIRQVLPLHDRAHRDWWACSQPWHGLHTRSRFSEQLLHVEAGAAVLLAGLLVRRPDRSVQRVVLSLRDPRARQRDAADGLALLSTVAHELRAPLTSVRGFSRTLQQRWAQLEDEQKLWMLEAVENDADRLSRLVGELLDISRIDTGRLLLVRQPVDLVDLFAAQVHRLVASGHDPERFDLSVADQLPDVWADPDRLTQVIGNLLENAIRHGAGTITVRIAPHDSADEGETVELAVADEGPGIPPDQRELVFDRFWQGRPHGGSGLGLYVVRGLAEAHGGGARVADSERGAHVVVWLPAGVQELMDNPVGPGRPAR